MGSFEYDRRSQPREGYQRHHLIPVAVVRHPAFAKIFAAVGRVGFNPHDFASNGVCLPACEALAIDTGLPLHRGPHPHYTQLVSEQVAYLCRDVRVNTPSGPMAFQPFAGQLATVARPVEFISVAQSTRSEARQRAAGRLRRRSAPVIDDRLARLNSDIARQTQFLLDEA